MNAKKPVPSVYILRLAGPDIAIVAPSTHTDCAKVTLPLMYPLVGEDFQGITGTETFDDQTAFAASFIEALIEA